MADWRENVDSVGRALQDEKRVRERVREAYLRPRDDFNQSAEYEDYLEEFEDLVHNLLFKVDEAKTMAKLNAYRKLYGERAKQVGDAIVLRRNQIIAADEEERVERERKRAEQREEEQERQRGLAEEKRVAQQRIAAGIEAIEVPKAPLEQSAMEAAERMFLVDPGAVPAYLREKVHTTRHKSHGQGSSMKSAQAAAAAAGSSERLWLDVAIRFALCADGLDSGAVR